MSSTNVYLRDFGTHIEGIHRDLQALIQALERVANVLELVVDGERSLNVRGLVVTREDRP